MLLKLTEHYQDARHVFAPGQEVDVEEELGAWLVEHGKAVQVDAPVIELSMEFDDDPIALPVVEDFKAVAEEMNNASHLKDHEPHPVDEPEDFEPSVDRKPARKRGKK